MTTRQKIYRPPGASYEIRVIGDRRRPLWDFYHLMLRLSWTATLVMIAAGFFVVNALFAVGYVATGGIANAHAGSFTDAFFFSVQTFGTIGYGAMYPASGPANVLVVAESVVGLTLTALTTGLLFAKFSRPTARVVFTRQAVISPMNGVPTLALRIGNERGNQIVDAQLRLVMSRTEHTVEGVTYYRSYDLELVRGRALSLSRSFSIFHRIDERSPLFGTTRESYDAQEVELQMMVVGLDDTSMQVVHASHRYFSQQVVWGARHADVLSESEDGAVVLDLSRFHDVEATAATESFPYPA